jgi:hypothetical protein
MPRNQTAEAPTLRLGLRVRRRWKGANQNNVVQSQKCGTVYLAPGDTLMKNFVVKFILLALNVTKHTSNGLVIFQTLIAVYPLL